MLVCFCCDEDVDCVVEKFSDRIWLDTLAKATVLRSFIFKVSGSRRLENFSMVLPFACNNVHVSDYSSTLLDENFHWNRRLKGTHGVIDKERRLVRFDDLEGRACKCEETIGQQAIGNNFCITTIRLHNSLEPGERGLFRLRMEVDNVGIRRPGPSWYFEWSYLRRHPELSILNLEKRQIKMWSILDEEQKLGGFDIHVAAPPELTLEGSHKETQDIKTIDTHTLDGKSGKFYEKVLWRLRLRIGKKLASTGEDWMIAGTYFKPIAPIVLKAALYFSIGALAVAIITLIKSFWP